MTGPAAPETTLPAFPALATPETALPDSSGCEEPSVAFETLLDEETGETGSSAQKIAESTDLEESLLLFPLFTPPAILLAQDAPRTESTQESPSPPAEGFSRVEHKLPPGPPPPRQRLEHIAEKPGWRGQKGDGMSAAKQPAMVFTNSKFEEKSAAAAEERQPLGVEYIETEGFAPGVPKIEVPRSSKQQNGGAESISPQALAGSGEPLSRDFSISDTVVAIEESHQMVSGTVEEIDGHVQVLRTSGQEKLEVVIRPEPGTQIYLQITKLDGQVQVQARCERGDFAALDASWSHVQSSLAAQGVRVEPLQQTAPGNPSFDQRQGAPDEHKRDRDARFPILFEQDTPNHKAETPADRARVWQRRGWQRWA